LDRTHPQHGLPLKIYLGSDAPDKYPGFAWFGGDPPDMVAIATDATYAAVLGNPRFPTIALVAYRPSEYGEAPYLLGETWDPDAGVAWAAFLDRETDAFAALAEHLMRSYPGKTFVLQNWEGDNALTLCGARDPGDGDKKRMAEWLSARQRGVERARLSADWGSEAAALVMHAAEVNRAMIEDSQHALWILGDNEGLSLPPDLVSYSFYEWGKQDCDEGCRQLEAGLAKLRDPGWTRCSPFAEEYLGHEKRVYVGEFGSPDLVVGGGVRQVNADLIPRVGALLRRLGCPLGLFWELQNNEEGNFFELRDGVGAGARPVAAWWALLSASELPPRVEVSD
jgi:hypothetical protein